MILKKIFSVILAFTMIFSFATSALADSVEKDNYEKAANILKDLDLLVGDEKGNLRLEENLKRQHMVVMISRIYGEEEKASKFEGINKYKDLKPKHKQDIHFITWATSKNLIAGYPNGTFGIDKYVTVQEYQSVLLRGLGHLKDGKNWDKVPEMSKTYGLMEGVKADPKAKMNRGAMAAMTLNALRQEKSGTKTTLAESLKINLPKELKVDVEVSVKGNSIHFKGQVKDVKSFGITLKPISSTIKMKELYSPIPLDKDGNFSYEINDLEIGEYNYRFQSGEEKTLFKSIKIDSIAFKFNSVTANNFKEIHLKLSRPVNKTLASLPGNYSTTAGNIVNIRFEEDDTKIILSLDEIMKENTKYQISANKIESINGEKVELKSHSFEAIDNEIPEIKSVRQLGNKGIRVIFSEPIKRSLVSNFKVNDKSVFGQATYEDNTVTLLYHSPQAVLKNGEHKLNLTDIVDYSGKKVSKSDFRFTVKEDTKAPIIKKVYSTAEILTIEFDKDIDPDSVSVNKIYWQDSANKYPKSVAVSGNKITADFSNNLLPSGENRLYVIGITDYSGNKFTEITKVQTLADTASLKVIDYKVSDDKKTISVSFNRAVNGSKAENYSVLDANRKNIDIRDVTGSGRDYQINLYKALPLGTNTLVIDGVKDSLSNETIRDFKAALDIKDTEKPALLSHTGYGSNIVLNFSKAMDEKTVTNPANYIMKFKGVQKKLPAGTSFVLDKDSRSLTILLPEKYEGDNIAIGRKGNLTELDITGLKDTNGNDTNPLIVNVLFEGDSTGKAKAIDYYSQRPGRQGVLVSQNEIKVKFNMPIVYAGRDDFSVDRRYISDVVADGSNIVTIYLEDADFTSISDRAVEVVYNNNMKTYIGTGVETEKLSVFDEIPPQVKRDIKTLAVYDDEIDIPFTEELESEGASLYKRDLEVTRLEDGKLLSEGDYSTFLNPQDNSVLIVRIDKRDVTSKYSIKISGRYNNGKISYIRDLDGNLAEESDSYTTSEIIIR